jgi:DNA-binding transcriptional MerR regulator/methylmalonyl-CoA mutase cobalamin-binding subunit
MAETTLHLAIYSIKAVAHMGGITEPTLRAWEKRYDILAPQRTESGHRRYTKRDIYRVIWLKQRLSEGMSISQAAVLLQAQPDSVLLEVASFEKAGRNFPGQPTANYIPPDFHLTQAQPSPVRSPQALMNQLLEAFLTYDEAAAHNLLAEAASFYPPETICLEIIQNVLVEVGERWARNEITVANEHFASAICRARITAMLEGLPLPQRGPLVLTACGPEEFHDLGILITTYCLRRHGWRVIYLGQNIPALDLEKDVRRLKPALVIFSCSRSETAYLLADEVVPVIAQVREDEVAGLLLAYGGRVFIEDVSLHNLFKDALYFGNNACESVNLMEKTFSRN